MLKLAGTLYVTTVCIYLSGDWMIQSTSSNRALSSNTEHDMRLPPGTCNELFCASIVSYCILQEQCRCHPAVNCSCCRQCAICLGDYYKHCCDCVHMCKKNVSVLLPTMTSTVDYLPDPDAELYRDLTKEHIPQLKYKIVRFPVIEELAVHHRSNAIDSPFVVDRLTGKGWDRDGMSAAEYWSQVNLHLKESVHFDIATLCTVSYFDQCVSLEDCTMSCSSMGAPSYRWFHNGCCECVGFSCLNYGNSYPKCQKCMT